MEAIELLRAAIAHLRAIVLRKWKAHPASLPAAALRIARTVAALCNGFDSALQATLRQTHDEIKSENHLPCSLRGSNRPSWICGTPDPLINTTEGRDLKW